MTTMETLIVAKDGDSWFFALPGFINLQESDVIFMPLYNANLDYIFKILNNKRDPKLQLSGKPGELDAANRDNPCELYYTEMIASLERQFASAIQAIGIMATFKPTMEMNVNDPVAMALEVASHVTEKLGEANRYAGELNRALQEQTEYAQKLKHQLETLEEENERLSNRGGFEESGV